MCQNVQHGQYRGNLKKLPLLVFPTFKLQIKSDNCFKIKIIFRGLLLKKCNHKSGTAWFVGLCERSRVAVYRSSFSFSPNTFVTPYLQNNFEMVRHNEANLLKLYWRLMGMPCWNKLLTILKGQPMVDKRAK